MTLHQLAAAVEDMADTLMGIGEGSTFSGMGCDEADSVAAVLALAGRMDAAGHVMMMHGEGDYEPDDRHHDIYEALNEPGAGFSHDEADKPFRLASAYARELV